MRARITLTVAGLSALVLVAGAAAGPFIGHASTTRARPGSVVHLEAGAGLRFYALLPLYLVPANRAPQPHDCTLRDGTSAICEPKVARPPRGGIFHRIGVVNVRHRNSETISYVVPRIRPGRYVYVMYCGPCYEGAGGSLIAFDHGEPDLTVLR